VLQATYPKDNSNIFHSTAQVKPQEQQLNKLASYTKLKLHKLQQQASKSKQPITRNVMQVRDTRDFTEGR
jgi:hypothetical protein